LILDLTEDIELKYATPIHMILVNNDEIITRNRIGLSIDAGNLPGNEIIYDKEDFLRKY